MATYKESLSPKMLILYENDEIPSFLVKKDGNLRLAICTVAIISTNALKRDSKLVNADIKKGLKIELVST